MDHGPWTVDHGPWTVDHGPWTVDHGLWTRQKQSKCEPKALPVPQEKEGLTRRRRVCEQALKDLPEDAG